MSWVYTMLLKLAGALIARYLMPLFRPEVRTALEIVLPIAERWVKAFVQTSDPGTKKRELASKQIWAELEWKRKVEKLDLPAITQADIDTAIQLGYYRLGLDAGKRTQP